MVSLRWLKRSSTKQTPASSEESEANSLKAEYDATESTPLVASSTSTEKTSEVPSSSLNASLDFDFDTDETKQKRNKGANGANRLTKLGQSFRQLSMRITEAVAEHTGSIGYLGSFAIAVNSLTGPAMLELPAAFAESGFIPTTITLIFVCFLSAFCSLHMANSISKIRSTSIAREDVEDDSMNDSNRSPYNHDFKNEVEFSAAFSYFWGRWPWFYVTHFLFWACITCLNISSIVDTSQVVDTMLGHTFGTVAFQIGHESNLVYWNSQHCAAEDLELGLCLPFADIIRDEGSTLFTLGTLITTIFFLPLALNDLKENAGWQILAFLVLLVCALQFVVQFLLVIDFSDDSISHHLPENATMSAEDAPSVDDDGLSSWDFWWGHKWDDLFGVVLFNYALVIAVPAWLYERQPHVDVPTVIYGSSYMSTFLYIAIGSLGRLALPNVSSNMLASLMSGANGLAIQLTASVFAFFIIGLGIPLFSVWTRLNLIAPSGEQQRPLCSRFVGNILAVYFPFCAAWFLYNGSAVTKLLSWGGIFFTSFVAFILPLSLALFVVKNFPAPGSIDVYGCFSLDSRTMETLALRGLLALATLSIVAAIAGDIF